MATKKQSTKRPTKTKQTTTRGKVPRSIKLTSRKVTIEFSNSHDLLDKLFGLTQSVSRMHTHQLLAQESGTPIAGSALDYISTVETLDVLGPQRAYDIVTNCAGETDLTKKLGDIPGLDPVIFKSCVQSGVIAAGYKPGDIPASAGTTLWDVVQAIQGCTK